MHGYVCFWRFLCFIYKLQNKKCLTRSKKVVSNDQAEDDNDDREKTIGYEKHDGHANAEPKQYEAE